MHYHDPVTVSWVAALLAGIFGIVGVLGGAALTGTVNSRIDKGKRAYEDQRRWLTDKRQLYARYLTLCESMLREIDGTACFLSYDGSSPIASDDEDVIRENLLSYMRRWDDEVQPLLQELELIASPRVSDLADRNSGALMELTGLIERRGLFVEHYPTWFQAKDLLAVLRNAMREELNFGPLPESYTFRRESDWPWLSDRPTRDSYVQHHDSDSPGAEPNAGPVPP
jgi:hypothetical protein